MLAKVSKQFWEGKLSLLFVFLIALHFLFLGSAPAGFNHDEIEKLASIKSFISVGADISGVAFPKALIATKTQGGQNNFPVILLALFFRVVPLNVVTARLPFVLLSVGSSFLLYQLVLSTTKKKNLSLAVFFVSLLNPWMWFLSRSITEAPFSLFFVLLGMYCIEKNTHRTRILAALSFIAAALSYWGTLVLIPLLFIGSVFVRRYKEREKKFLKFAPTVILFFAVFLVISLFLLFTKDSTIHTRSGELIFQNIGRYQLLVDTIRRQSVVTSFTIIFVNKYFFLLRDFALKYISVLSPDFLFVKGDPRATYQFGSHGMLLLLDLPLLILGLFSLGRAKKDEGTRRLLGYTLLLCLIAPLGSSLNIVENSYVFRSVLILPVLIIVSAMGLTRLFTFSKKIGLMVSVLYLFLFVNFLNFYLFEYPVSHQENQFWSEDVAAAYIARVPASTAVTVVTAYPIQLSEKYAFYTRLNFSADLVRAIYAPPVLLGNIKITSECENKNKGVLIVQEGVNCEPQNKTPFKVIENFADSGSLWKIYNDPLCSDFKLDAYRSIHTLADYRLYNENTSEFCMRQIHQYE